MASKASVRTAEATAASPSVAAGTMSPRTSPAGMHLNATKSLVSAVQELKAAASAIKDLNSAAGDMIQTDDELLKKDSPSAKLASQEPGRNAAPGSPKKSPTAASLASEVAKTLSKSDAAAPMRSRASIVAAQLTPAAVPSLAAGTLLPRASVATPDRKKSSSTTSSEDSETRRQKKEGGEVAKRTSEVVHPSGSATATPGSKAALQAGSKRNVGSVVAGSKAALLGSKQNIEIGSKAIIAATGSVAGSNALLQAPRPGSKASIAAAGSAVAGSKAALGSRQNVEGSRANIGAGGSVIAGSKVLLGSKQNLEGSRADVAGTGSIVIPGSKTTIPIAASVITGSREALGSRHSVVVGSKADIPAAGSVVADSKAMLEGGTSKDDIPTATSVLEALGSQQYVGSKRHLQTGSEADMAATGSVTAGSKAMLQTGSRSVTAASRQTLAEAIAGSRAELARRSNAGSKASLGSKRQLASEAEPEVELTSSPVRQLPVFDDDGDTPPAPPLPPSLATTRKL